MELEDYLIGIKPQIIAITKISQLIETYLTEYDYDEVEDTIYALNKAIRMILYCMRKERNEYYKYICEDYNDDFSYDSVIYCDL